MIPPILHQIWMNPKENGTEGAPPPKIHNYIQGWKNKHPNYQHILWNGKTMKKYMQQNFPQYLDLYQNLQSWIQRCDAFRYFVLWKMGGIYIDADTVCKAPLDPWLKNKGIVMITKATEDLDRKDLKLTNCFMASSPKNHFFQTCMENLRKSEKKTSVFQSTGPTYLTDTYHEYSGNPPVTAIRESDLPIDHKADNSWFKTQAIMYLEKWCWLLILIVIGIIAAVYWWRRTRNRLH